VVGGDLLKRINNIFNKVISFENLMIAYKKSMKGSSGKTEACKFFFNSENEILKLHSELKAGKYIPEKYRYFIIKEPKERVISVASFRDRVVHHAIINVLEPIFEKVFISHSYATRKNKGTHKAIKTAQKYLRNNFYYLKTDISKYFESINHTRLLELIKKKIKDKKLFDLIVKIILNSDISRRIDSGKGLPIGNLTSQFFANIYLNGFDHYVKEKLGAKYYLRYMDDFVIFSDDKDQLKKLIKKIKFYLKTELNLKLKEKATFLNTQQNGLTFLGVRIFSNLIRIKNKNLKRLKKKLKKREYELRNNLINSKEYLQSVMSIIGYMESFNTFRLRKKIL